MAQSQLADALLGKVAGENFRVGAGRRSSRLSLDGPLELPPLDVDAAVAGDGTLQSVKLRGGDKLMRAALAQGQRHRLRDQRRHRSRCRSCRR